MRNRNNTAGQLARLSQALSKRESISGCDPDEIYYQLNFYHFAVERQSGTGNCSPVTRKHYQKITTFRCKFWVVHDKHKRKHPQNHSAFVQPLSVRGALVHYSLINVSKWKKENTIKNNKLSNAHSELSMRRNFQMHIPCIPWQK